MRAGSLDKKVEFQSLTKSKNSFKEVVEEWNKFVEAYVSILPLRGKEYFSSKGVKSEVSHKLQMRYMDGITSDMKIVYGVRTFEIESVINIREENKTLELMLTEDV